MILITSFNCLTAKLVVRANSVLTFIKIGLIICIVAAVSYGFANTNLLIANYHRVPLSLDSILSTVSDGGICFAFVGLLNGSIMACYAAAPRKSVKYSLFLSIIIVGLLDVAVSLMYIACVADPLEILQNRFSPLLTLAMATGVDMILVITLAGNALAPLGAANVYTQMASQSLYSFSLEFPTHKGRLIESPSQAAWISLLVGIVFLTITHDIRESFRILSGLSILTYLAGPLVLRSLSDATYDKSATLEFKAWQLEKKPIASDLGFVGCSLLLYWLDFTSLVVLVAVLFSLIIVAHALLREPEVKGTASCLVLLTYLIALIGIKYLCVYSNSLLFTNIPFGYSMVVIISLATYHQLTKLKLDSTTIQQQISHSSSSASC
jgi:amino acid transporter